MSASNGIIGFGTVFSYSADDVTYTDLAELVDVKPPETTVGAAKFTHNGSPNAHHEYKPGLAEGGEPTFKLWFAKAGYATLKGFLRTTKYWKITYPDLATTASTDKFQGFISKIGKECPMEEGISVEVSIKISGPVTFTAGT